jgi:hypothetical protein
VRASLLLRQRFDLANDTFAEVVIWALPRQLPGSEHRYKYRLALMSSGTCVLRYDNESGKGDHKHLGSREVPYAFEDVESLQVDFWTDVDEWLKRK